MTELIKDWTIEDLEAKLENEGLDYFFTSYISVNTIVDNNLKKAVEQYLEARGEILSILEEHGVEIYD